MIQHRVKLTDDTPICCKPYPLPYPMREELQNEVDSMLEMGVVRSSTSPYATLIVMVKKKDGSNKVCVNFRKLNKITEVDPETMTTAEDLFRRLSGMKYLSKIYLTKGYWQIPVAQEDVYKTAFVTPDGVIYSDSWEEHLRTLKELFGRLRRAWITARPTKCLLIANRMEFLGHQIGGNVINLSNDNLEKVPKTPHPTK